LKGHFATIFNIDGLATFTTFSKEKTVDKNVETIQRAVTVDPNLFCPMHSVPV